MIIYNTTYQMPEADARDFVVWMSEVMVPRLKQTGYISGVRLSRILSHKDDDSECFALQFEIESTARLHYWFVKQGQALGKELLKTFDNRVLGFFTMMEVVVEGK